MPVIQGLSPVVQASIALIQAAISDTFGSRLTTFSVFGLSLFPLSQFLGSRGNRLPLIQRTISRSLGH